MSLDCAPEPNATGPTKVAREAAMCAPSFIVRPRRPAVGLRRRPPVPLPDYEGFAGTLGDGAGSPHGSTKYVVDASIVRM